jgi:hypothetical protein
MKNAKLRTSDLVFYTIIIWRQNEIEERIGRRETDSESQHTFSVIVICISRKASECAHNDAAIMLEGDVPSSEVIFHCGVNAFSALISRQATNPGTKIEGELARVNMFS